MGNAKWPRTIVMVAAAFVLVGHTSRPVLAQDALRGVALIVGESEYQRLPALANPRGDARAVSQMLSRLGFDVTTATDTDRATLEVVFQRFVLDAKDADVALVYYSGHGVEIGGENFLIPIDADVSTPKMAGTSLLSVTDLLAQLQDAAPIAILLLDACRTSPFQSGQLIELPGTTLPQSASPSGLAVVRGPQPVTGARASNKGLGVVVGFAAEPGKPALDGPPGFNSPYATALLKHVAAGNYSFSDVMTLVSEEVYLGTNGQQLPWTNSALRRVLSFGRAPAETEDPDEAMILRGRRDLLLTISSTPPEIRTAVATIAEREQVPLAPMFGLLKAAGIDTDDPEDLNARLQSGAEEIKARLAQLSAITTPDPEICRLLELGRRAQAEGAVGEALAFSLRASARTAELSRTLDSLAADIATRRAENVATFAEAADAAMLAWDFRTAAGQFELAADEAQKAGAATPRTAFYRTRQANALVALGNYKGDNPALAEAIAIYRNMLTQLPRESMPLDWAQTQSNLGIALRTLGERETGTARLREAVAAHRAALEVRTRELDPAKWAASKSNLGIALRTLSSRTGKIAELEEAATAFGRALEVQTREASPTGWASTQSNIGSVLLIMGDRNRDAAALRGALTAYRQALEVLTRDRDPLRWAETQHNIAIALKILAGIEDDRGLLKEAIAAYRLALAERTQTKVPLKWASTMHLLANALRALGDADNDRGRLWRPSPPTGRRWRSGRASVFRSTGRPRRTIWASRCMSWAASTATARAWRRPSPRFSLHSRSERASASRSTGRRPRAISEACLRQLANAKAMSGDWRTQYRSTDRFWRSGRATVTRRNGRQRCFRWPTSTGPSASLGTVLLR